MTKTFARPELKYLGDAVARTTGTGTSTLEGIVAGPRAVVFKGAKTGTGASGANIGETNGSDPS